MGKIDERLRIEGLVDRLHISTAKVGIHADLVTHFATKQSIDRKAERLAEDIPARLFQAADRAHANHTHTEERMAVQLLIDMLNIARILADQHRSEIFNRTGYGAGLPLEGCLSPAKKTGLIGNDLYKNPIPHLCVDDNGLYISNFHRALRPEKKTADPSTTLPPDLLSDLVGSANFMRHSLKKAAYVAFFRAA
jgi:hypothetical protein